MSSLSAQRSFSNARWSKAQAELDARMRLLYGKARLLVGVTGRRDMSDRARLVRALERGEMVEPNWEWTAIGVEARIWKLLDEARELAEHSAASPLYLRRLESLELELSLLEVLGKPRAVRPMVARLYGDGRDVPDGESRSLADIAQQMLGDVQADDEPRTLPASCENDAPSVVALVKRVAQAARLDIDVRVDPSLTANAAVGERTVFLADRAYGKREAVRFAVHEVLGHLVSQFNGRAQPLAIFAFGTAGSFADQEGVAIYLEELAGVLSGSRIRTLAARVVATDAMHRGARFGEVARLLVRDYGFSASESIALCERAYRGGGVARDAVYLRCWLNVRRAIDHRRVSLSELQLGKISLQDVGEVRELLRDGLVRPNVYCPNFALSFVSTGAGTNSETSPPNRATSLTKFDAT